MAHVNPGYEVVASSHRTYWQGTANDDLIIYDGSIQAGAGNDTLIAAASEGPGQIHLYGQAGSDRLVLSFKANINSPSSGHHAAGELKGEANRSANTFAFTNTSNIVSGGVIVGRLQDFDYSRDTISIDSVNLDLTDLPDNVRLVLYNGNHNDPGAEPQQWLLIETATGGVIFYALGGFRVDMTGDGESGQEEQEIHFIDTDNLPNFDLLPDVKYVDPMNHVPLGYSPNNGGIIINDDDINIEDVMENITGSIGGDLIAAGLNNDTVYGDAGNDRIWGGDGNDYLNGQTGNDTIYGGNGADVLVGSVGNDVLAGERGDDVLQGDAGNDNLRGAWGHDILTGGAGADMIYGWSGNDAMYGGTESDVFVFNVQHGVDTIHDLEESDRLDLRALTSIQTFAQLMAAARGVGADVVIETGSGNKIILEDVSLTELDAGDFIF